MPNVTIEIAPLDQVSIEIALTGQFSVELGNSGYGIPPGGVTGQVLKKHSDVDYDVYWGSGGGSGGSGDISFIFTQGVASQTWLITHNLGKYPSVSVADSSGNQGFGTVRYIDADSLTVSFGAAFAGVAYLN